MTGSGRIPRIGAVLAAGALIALAGCQQVASRSGASSPLGWGNQPKGGEKTITPAQEADVQISMGRAAEQQGDLDQAMAAYRAAVERDHRRADAYARMAVLNDKQGKFRESAELYRKALAVQPGDPDIFCDMGYSFYLQRRWAEAEMNLRQSIAINPDHQRAHNNLALLLVRDNRLDDALAEFRKGGSDPVHAHLNLAFALTIDQRWESARAEYQRALAIDPSCQLAKTRLDQLNTLVARRESSDGALPGQAPIATATAAPPSVPASVSQTTTATAQKSAQLAPRSDAAVVATAAVSPSTAQGYRPMKRVARPSLPAETGAMARLWSSVDAPGAPAPAAALPAAALPAAAGPPPRAASRRSIPAPRPVSSADAGTVDPTPKSNIGP
jgi:tetratricopeptide (TPR) repeat protein